MQLARAHCRRATGGQHGRSCRGTSRWPRRCRGTPRGSRGPSARGRPQAPPRARATSRRRAPAAGCAPRAAPRARRGEVRRHTCSSDRAVVASELDGDCQAALHVACSETVDESVGDVPRQVVLRRHRVVVRHEHDERQVGSVGAARRGTPRRRRTRLPSPSGTSSRSRSRIAFSAAALRRNVHELERPRGETVGERGHRRSVQRHNPAVTARQPDPAPGAEPERAFLVGVYPKGSDGERRARRAARARPDLGRRAGRRDRRSIADGPTLGRSSARASSPS